MVVAGTTIAFDGSSVVLGSPPPTQTLSCNNSWTGNAPTADWGSTANWTAGVPNSTTSDVCILGNATILLDASFSIGELTVTAGSNLAIGLGGSDTTTGSLSVSSGLENDGSLTVGPSGTSDQAGLTLDGPITNTGSLTVDGIVDIGSSSTVSTEVSNDGTIGVGPGGLINVSGPSTITNEPDGLLAFGIDGPASSFAAYGRITNGNLSLAGSADPVYENGFTPSPGAEYVVVTGTSTGTFSSVLHDATADYSHPGEVGLTGGAPATVTTTSVTSSVTADPSYGQAVQLTATVIPVSGSNPTGSVSFATGNLLLGSSAVTTSAAGVTSAALNVATLPVGSDSITATYSGDVVFGTSTSPVLTELVNPDPTFVTITPSSSSPEPGQPVTDTATVSLVNLGVSTPTGTVSFTDNGSPLTGCQSLGLPALGPLQASCTETYGSDGTHSIVANYSGDADVTASTGSLAETVLPMSTTTTVVPSPSASTFGQSVTLTATVAPTSGTDNPDGTVTFICNGIALGSSTVSTTGGVSSASMLVTTLPLGSAAITASYGGDTDFLASTSVSAASVTVSQAPTTLGLLSSDAPSAAGQSVTLTAVVFPTTGSGETGTVTFFDQGTAIGTSTVSTGQATLTVSSLPAGDDSITARYTGDGNFKGSSSMAPLSQVVGQT